MNYQQSTDILDKIKSSNNILLNCHASPDADSVGSALATHQALLQLNKQSTIVCPHKIPSSLQFLTNKHNLGQVEKVNFNDFNFNEFDLFLANDSANWNRIAGLRKFDAPKIFTIAIDHHDTTQNFGEINLVDKNAAANCEILYKLFKDWGVDFNDKICTPLLTGIIGDTGAFRFPEADQELIKIADELLSQADKNEIILNLYQGYSSDHIHFWAEVLQNVKIENNYAFSAISKEIFEKHNRPVGAKSEIADMLFQSIKGTDFGMVIIEENEGFVSVSFRSRTGTDVSKFAEKLEGGGHIWAAAGRVYDLPLTEAVEKILNTVQNKT